jgi:hypothetical protein
MEDFDIIIKKKIPSGVNYITQVIHEYDEKQRPPKQIPAERQRALQEAMKEFQKHDPEIVCWLSNYKTSLHNHQKVQKR